MTGKKTDAADLLLMKNAPAHKTAGIHESERPVAFHFSDGGIRWRLTRQSATGIYRIYRNDVIFAESKNAAMIMDTFNHTIKRG